VKWGFIATVLSSLSLNYHRGAVTVSVGELCIWEQKCHYTLPCDWPPKTFSFGLFHACDHIISLWTQYLTTTSGNFTKFAT